MSFIRNINRHHVQRLASNVVASKLLKFSCARLMSSNAGPTRDSSGQVIDYNFTNICEMQEKACEYFKPNKLLGTRSGDHYDWITYGEFAMQVQKFRNVLAHHNIGKNDKVVVISNNRTEWAVAMYAVAGVGAQWVPMYEAQLEKDWRYIVNDCEAKLILAANDKIRDRAKSFIGTVGKVESILSIDCSDEYMHSYKRWMKLVESEPPVPRVEIVDSDILTYIYTSGTTGNPKGVELSHANIVANLMMLKDVWQGQLRNHTSLAFLPWAHIFGQTAELHSLLATGSAMGIVSNREEILECLQILKPSMIMSVPLLFNKVYDGILKKVSQSSPLRQKIFHGALRISRRRNDLLERQQTVGAWLAFQHRMADKIVFKKVRDGLGGNIKFMPSGGAAVGLKVLQFFEDIGIPICEGYGLTETAPVITSSAADWETRRLGCSGVVLKGQTLRIVDADMKEVPLGQEGEITVSGANVMVGYRNNPAANAEVFYHHEGKRYFRTGDLGRVLDGKFLKLTGRIKEQYKLENGKYVVPAPLEDMITRSGFIAQAFLYGDNKPYNVALIVPDVVELTAWAQKNSLPVEGVTSSDKLTSLLRHNAVLKLLGNELQEACSVMKSYERPQRWLAIADAFTPDNQMLTPKLSLRRNNVMKAYEQAMAGLYAGTCGSSSLTTGRQETE